MSDIKGLVLHIGRDDIWLEFTDGKGRRANFSVAAIAERSVGTIGATVTAWAEDRIADHQENKSEFSRESKRIWDEATNHNDGQFGVGA